MKDHPTLFLGVKLTVPFDEDDRRARAQKMYFFKGAAEVKATTLYSFKGWESRALLVHLNRSWNPKDRAVAYAGLTRLKRSTRGSILTVVCECPKAGMYGRRWPEFHLA